MEEKGKHIDEVFREGLSDLNVTPPSDAWSEIENRVHRRKVIPFYIPGLVAASLLLFVLTGSLWLIFLRKPSEKGLADHPVFSIKPEKKLSAAKKEKSKKITPPPVEKQGTATEKTSRERPSVTVAATTAPAKKKGTEPLFTSTPVSSVSAEDISRPEKVPLALPPTQLAFLSPLGAAGLYGKEDEAVPLDNSRMDDYLRAEALPVSPVLKNQPQKKGTWGIGGDFGPVYAYRHITEGNPMMMSYLNSSENGIISFAGNFSFFYEGSKRFSVQSGIGYYRMGQEVNDVVAFRMIKSGDLALLESKGNDFIVASEGKPGYSGTPVFVANRKGASGNEQVDFLLTRLGSDLYEPVDVQLKQELEFVEIPLLLRYKIVDRTVGLNFIGGVGTSFLVKGQTSVISDQGTTVIGDMYDLQKTNFNGTLGLGLSYKVSAALRLRLEPTLKYYLNPVYQSLEISTHPYSIGLYTGMSFYF